MVRPVFLVGMMASGKTTVGRRLAVALDAVFCDLDERVERISGRSIERLFAQGEDRFRALEAAALGSLLAEPGFAGGPCVVATGGGVVVAAENRAAMRRVGTVVLLEVAIDELERRLGATASARPLLRGTDPREALTRLWGQRQAAYRDGTLVVQADGAPEVVAAAILERLRPEAPA